VRLWKKKNQFIKPNLKNLTTLKEELEELKNKNWKTILI
jgi:hypothetical protein